jgi:hypothetical protein
MDLYGFIWIYKITRWDLYKFIITILGSLVWVGWPARHYGEFWPWHIWVFPSMANHPPKRTILWGKSMVGTPILEYPCIIMYIYNFIHIYIYIYWDIPDIYHHHPLSQCWYIIYIHHYIVWYTHIGIIRMLNHCCPVPRYWRSASFDGHNLIIVSLYISLITHSIWDFHEFTIIHHWCKTTISINH